MGALTSYGKSLMINRVFRAEAAPSLDSLWVALTTSIPVVTDTGASIIEPAAASYSRSPYPLGAGYWTMNGAGQVANLQAISWLTPGDDWGEVIGWALCTESSSGMAVGYGRLQRPMTILAGSRPRMAVGMLVASIS